MTVSSTDVSNLRIVRALGFGRMVSHFELPVRVRVRLHILLFTQSEIRVQIVPPPPTATRKSTRIPRRRLDDVCARFTCLSLLASKGFAEYYIEIYIEIGSANPLRSLHAGALPNPPSAVERTLTMRKSTRHTLHSKNSISNGLVVWCGQIV